MAASEKNSGTAQCHYLAIPSLRKEIRYRLYNSKSDEAQVCDIVHAGALPGGRPFPLVPQTRALSFGRIVTGPFARTEPGNFIVAVDLSPGRETVVSYLTGALKRWHIEQRNRQARQIALSEFGGITPFRPSDTLKAFFTVSTVPKRTVRFLLHAMQNQEKEMPEMPPAEIIRFGEWHWSTHPKYRGQGISISALVYFLERALSRGVDSICIQVTVCEGRKVKGKNLSYYLEMEHKGNRIWEIYDIKETRMYTEEEKHLWRLGEHVYNATLYTETELLYDFAKSQLH